MERGSATKSQKGKKAYVERKVGECFSVKAHGQCSKGDSGSFSHDKIALAKVAVVRDEMDDRLLPHQIRRQRLTVESGNRDDSSDKRSQILSRHKNCKNPVM